MFDRDELGNYKVSSVVFVSLLIIGFVFLLYNVRASNDICVFEVKGYDLIDNFDSWLSYEIGREEVWDAGIDIPVNDEGYPRVIPFKKGIDVYAVKTILHGKDSVLEDGTYSLSFKGNGKIKTGFDAQESFFEEAGTYDVIVVGSEKGVYLGILESDILDPIRDLHFYSPIKKELRSCIVQSSHLDEVIEDVNSSYIVVSNSSLLESVDSLDISQSYNLKDKIITGLITLFAILAVIYILK